MTGGWKRQEGGGSKRIKWFEATPNIFNVYQKKKTLYIWVNPETLYEF